MEAAASNLAYKERFMNCKVESVVGIDVSKDSLDICVLGRGCELSEVANLSSGFTKIANLLSRLGTCV